MREPSVTQFLQRWSAGDQEAAEQALPLIYDELRRIASRELRRERGDHTLQATAIVHEAYMRLAAQPGWEWSSRAHFFAFSAHLIRRILVDHARRRNSEKRGGGITPVTIGAALDVAAQESFDVVALDVALENLEKVFPQQAKIVELRFYGGLTIDETAEALRVSAATISREWTMARAWLRRALSTRP
jgi:RNA polymerase sigma factor (TIGR02999 family)